MEVSILASTIALIVVIASGGHYRLKALHRIEERLEEIEKKRDRGALDLVAEEGDEDAGGGEG